MVTVRSFGLNPSLTPLLGSGLAVCPEPDRVFCFGSAALVQQNLDFSELVNIP